METIIFKIDKKLKIKAQKNAKKRGFSLSDYYRRATYDLAEDTVNMEIVKRPKLNAKTRRDLIRISKDAREGKNLSPVFDNVQDAINYLENNR